MKKNDLDIIKKVIEEEGMRRDIGLLIDQSVPMAPAESWWASLKGKLLLIGVISAVVVAGVYFITDLESRDNAVLPTVKETETIVVDLETNQNIESAKNINTNDDKITENVSPNKEVELLNKNKTEDNAYIENSIGHTTTSRSASPMKGNTKSSSQGDTDIPNVIGSDLTTDRNITDDFKERSKYTSIPISDSNNAVDSEVYAEVPEQTSEKSDVLADGKTNQDTSTQSQIGNENSAISLVLADSTGRGDNGDSVTASTNDKMRKWDIALGGGYAFVSTGDIRSLTGNMDVNYRLNNKWALSGQTSIGMSTQPKEIVEATFWQGKAVAYFSPFGNNKTSDFRLGAGAGYYRIDHTFISSVTTIGGAEEIEYANEIRQNLGYTLSIENRLYLKNRLIIGLGVYTNQYLNEDAISGVKLNLGYAF